MNIKQASEQSGVSAPNIRFYEKEGLLTPARRQGNDYRDYTAGDVRTLKLIRMLRMLDVPLPTIKAVLRGEQPLQQALQAQQAAVQAAVGIQDICPEPLGQHWQQRRTEQQDLAGDLVGIHQRDTMGGKYRRHSRFAAAAAAGDPKRDHSWITRNAAARIRRLYTAMDRPSFWGQRA